MFHFFFFASATRVNTCVDVLVHLQPFRDSCRPKRCHCLSSSRQRSNLPVNVEFTERLGRGSSILQESGAAVSVNLRDCCTFASNLKPGLLFRSSQVLRLVSIEFAAIHCPVRRPVVYASFSVVQCSRSRPSSYQGTCVLTVSHSSYRVA